MVNLNVCNFLKSTLLVGTYGSRNLGYENSLFAAVSNYSILSIIRRGLIIYKAPGFEIVRYL